MPSERTIASLVSSSDTKNVTVLLSGASAGAAGTEPPAVPRMPSVTLAAGGCWRGSHERSNTRPG
ncbi:MAG: hypothetical protein E6J68_10350 [Deltaproteobacteria bacterium]|nr:MAG: hypothetical protein E6J68_10350 [Deltaproteobacteria bacterium]